MSVAQYQINLHNSAIAIVESIAIEIWEGNRDRTNFRALAIAQTIYAYLVFGDAESLAAMWLAIGNEGEEIVKAIAPLEDWTKGAVTIDYPVRGRLKTACFCLDRKLGQRILPGDRLFPSDAAKGFDLAI